MIDAVLQVCANPYLAPDSWGFVAQKWDCDFPSAIVTVVLHETHMLCRCQDELHKQVYTEVPQCGCLHN